MEELREETASVGRLMSDLASEIGTLVRQEFELARCEILEKAEDAKGAAGRMGTGGAMAHAGILALAAGAVLGLTLLLANWMATLPAAAVAAGVVGLVLGLAGYALFRSGAKAMSPAHYVPRRTIESVKEDARWARERIV